MKGVLTQKEFNELNAKRFESNSVISKSEPRENKKTVSAPVSKEEYYLFSPDNPQQTSKYINRSIVIDIGLEKKDVLIKDGIARTDNIKVKEILERQGYVFLYTKPKEEI